MHKYSMRLLFISLCAVLFAGSALAAPSLAERRAITAYESGAYAVHLKDIRAAAGFAVPVEVKWDTIAGSGQSDAYGHDDYWTNIYFVPLKKALVSIAIDAMGKKALKEHLKKIVIHYNEATAPSSDYAKGVSFKGGVLTLNFRPFANGSDIDPRAQAIQKVLEDAL
ncbi:MAG: hypothetical protein LBU53_08440 [Zoogloeaceae bacterium]|jgi:hypothetical protein|nr:hypothetical protein [Zoogloeaceae bacterium]